MLNKLLKLASFSRTDHHHRPKSTVPALIPQQPAADAPSSAVLKIVHAGGKVECYYMAIPAIRIMEKYPSCLLAKPEVFRRPWDSVVRPEKLLTPGKKFFLVPRHTVKKLRRRIRKPSKDQLSKFSFLSQASSDNQNDDVSSSSCTNGVSSEVSGSFMTSSVFGKKSGSGVKKHVRFVGIDHVKHKAAAATGSSTSEEEGKKKGSLNFEPSQGGGKRGSARFQNDLAWQPSLTAITESQGN